jgi:hypothetical protein
MDLNGSVIRRQALVPKVVLLDEVGGRQELHQLQVLGV